MNKSLVLFVTSSIVMNLRGPRTWCQKGDQTVLRLELFHPINEN